MLRSTSIWYGVSLFKQFQRCASSIPTPVLSTDKVVEEIPGETIQKNKENGSKESDINNKALVSAKSELVKSAFANLKHNQLPPKDSLDKKIEEAKTVEEMLAISETSTISKREALKIVSILTEWSLSGKTRDSSFESDPRFIALCQNVGTSKKISYSRHSRNGDLSLVLGVTGEDEAAKIIDSISLPQMIKVLSSLSSKKRRSLPLLRALAFNIGRTPTKLDIKQSADIIYAITSLNFPDEVLLEKVTNDMIECLPRCQKSAVFGSICTSLGLLRYKESELLDVLCNWAVKNNDICRTQDLVSLLLCLANVRHVPNQEVLELFCKVSEDELPSATTWLDVVWALTVLDSVSHENMSSVLNTKFVDRLSTSAGPLLDEENNLEVPLTRTKEKHQLIASLLDALSNFLPSSHYFRSSVDIGMGFLIDAECIIDAKMNPSPLIDKKTGLPIEDSSKKSRIAFMMHEYHDCTRGHVELSGSSHLNAHLASLAGYRVINILYTDYNARAKLLKRVQYIEGLIKAVVTQPET